MAENRDTLSHQIDLISGFAESSLREQGEVGLTYVFAFGQMLMPMPVTYRDAQEKQRVIELARAIVHGYWPSSVGFYCEAWMSVSAGFAGVQPSEADDRVEVVVVSVETPAQTDQRIYRMVRDGDDVRLERDPVMEGDGMSGRFIGLFPEVPPAAAIREQARAFVRSVVPREVVEQMAEHGGDPAPSARN